jgi:hypothetical protein
MYYNRVEAPQIVHVAPTRWGEKTPGHFQQPSQGGPPPAWREQSAVTLPPPGYSEQIIKQQNPMYYNRVEAPQIVHVAPTRWGEKTPGHFQQPSQGGPPLGQVRISEAPSYPGQTTNIQPANTYNYHIDDRTPRTDHFGQPTNQNVHNGQLPIHNEMIPNYNPQENQQQRGQNNKQMDNKNTDTTNKRGEDEWIEVKEPKISWSLVDVAVTKEEPGNESSDEE